ncbi:MAG: serine hydrolase domain-containing protein [Marmoricola sp.]
MRRSRKVILGVVVVVLVVVVGGYFYERPLLLTGTGYAAHNACALDAIAHRDDAGDDLPSNPLVPLLRTSTEDSGARASILGVLARKRAWSTPGYGCTLAEHRPDLPPATTVTSAGNPYTSAPVATDVPASVGSALDRAFGDDLPSKARKDLGTRGVVVLKDGRLVAERYAHGFTASTPQLGWSMTKSLTNLLVGRLVAQHQVSLEDDHLRPEWKDARSRITIRQLLQMTSGLHWDETYSLGTPITRMLYLEPDMARYVAAQKLDHASGTYLQYSSGSTTLLCSILAKGRGGADFPRRELFAPLGLSSFVLEPDASGTPVCSSYGWATPRDWAALGQFALDDGHWAGKHLLPIGWMADSTKAVAVKKSEEKGYASGWWSNTQADGSLVEKDLPGDTYFAEGHDGQWIVVVPSHHLVVARLGFTPDTGTDDRVVRLTADLLTALG